MKATIDIPDDLFRRVEEKSALQGLPVDAVVAELLRRGLDDGPTEIQGAARASNLPAPTGQTRRQRAKQLPTPEWLKNWFRAADDAFKDAPPGPTAREILERDRDRLERR